MSEPGTATFIITTTAVALLGPVLGPNALIVFAAVVGGLLAMSRTPLSTKVEALKFVAVGVLVALVLTGPFVWAVSTYTPVPGHVALVPMAFILGAARNGVLTLMDKCLDAFAAALGVLLNALAARKGKGE